MIAGRVHDSHKLLSASALSSVRNADRVSPDSSSHGRPQSAADQCARPRAVCRVSNPRRSTRMAARPKLATSMSKRHPRPKSGVVATESLSWLAVREVGDRQLNANSFSAIGVRGECLPDDRASGNYRPVDGDPVSGLHFASLPELPSREVLRRQIGCSSFSSSQARASLDPGSRPSLMCGSATLMIVSDTPRRDCPHAPIDGSGAMQRNVRRSLQRASTSGGVTCSPTILRALSLTASEEGPSPRPAF